MTVLRLTTLGLLPLAALSACGVGEGPLLETVAADVDASTVSQALTGEEGAEGVRSPLTPKPYIRPKGITLQIPLEQSRASGGVQSLADHHTGAGFSPFFTVGGEPLPVYLERRSVTYTAGRDNSSENRSSVVRSGSRTVSAYQGSDEQWDAIVSCVTEQFSRFNVQVTDVEPSSGEYIEAKFGGHPSQLGLPNGVGGVAPIDNFSCNIIPRAVVYTFSDVLGNSPRINCEVAAQEIAHAFSLDHEFLCQDPMTYLNGCGAKTFQDTDAQCGEYEPRQCNCNRSSHNSVKLLLNKLGPSGPTTPPDPSDTAPPVATIVSPQNGASMPGGGTIEVQADVTDLATAVVATELIWDFSNEIFPCPTSLSGGAVTCTRAGNRSTWRINVGQGARTFSVRARDQNGNTVTTPARTIQLSTDSSTPEPSGDEVDPIVAVLSPQDGAALRANTTIEIEATASDDTGLASVELLWSFTDDRFPCPFSGQAVSCTKTGDTYLWRVSVGVGSRGFQVQAVDLAGNVSLSPERAISLAVDPPSTPETPTNDVDAAEPNNTMSAAFNTRCGTAIDLVAAPSDDDWFVIDAPAGTNIQAGLDAAPGSPVTLALLRSDGSTLLAEQTDPKGEALTVTALDDAVLARITTTSRDSVSYRLAVTCGTNDVEPVPERDDDLEPNNTSDSASQAFCGQTLPGLSALDDDFFVLTVRANDTVTASLDTERAHVTLLDAAGNELSAAHTAARVEGLAAGEVYARVAPLAEGVAYSVRFACEPGAPALDPVAESSCSAGDQGATAGLLGVLALLLGRRRVPARIAA